MSETSTEQQLFMDQDMCILLDINDNIIGQQSKRFCHISENIKQKLTLHRAFSVFLFNEKNQLLLQERASTKITFPSMWTNTCCSHPLFSIPEEKEGIKGARIAAQRKLEHELGIPKSQIELDKLQYMTRIMYEALYDEDWGESEIDYCFIYQTKESELTLNPEKDEIDNLKWVTKEELFSMLEDKNLKFTPWFKLIAVNFLDSWWTTLENEGFDKLSSHADDKIHPL